MKLISDCTEYSNKRFCIELNWYTDLQMFVFCWESSYYFCHASERTEGKHYCDVITSTMASQITSGTIVYLTVYSGADQRKYQSSVSLAFVRGIHRWPVNSPHKGPVTRKIFLFDDVIMRSGHITMLQRYMRKHEHVETCLIQFGTKNSCMQLPSNL